MGCLSLSAPHILPSILSHPDQPTTQSCSGLPSEPSEPSEPPTITHRSVLLAIAQEMFRQGDREKSLGQPVSPLMDRARGGVTKSQTGFFNIVAIPIYTVSGDPPQSATWQSHTSLKRW